MTSVVCVDSCKLKNVEIWPKRILIVELNKEIQGTIFVHL